EQVMRSGRYAYRDRRARKRDFRRLWIVRINAAARREGLSYSQLIHGLDEAGVEVNRKMLAEVAVHDPEAFRRFAELAREAVGAYARRHRPAIPGRPTTWTAFFARRGHERRVITPPHNEKLKRIRGLHARR